MDPYPLEQPDLSTDPRMKVRLMEREFHLQYTPTDHAPPQPPIKVLSFKPGEHDWLLKLIFSIPSEKDKDSEVERMLQANNFKRSDFDKVYFCTVCNRGLYKSESPNEHQALDPPHSRYSLVEVVNSGGGYHVQAEILTRLGVPVGDVLTHVVSHPYTCNSVPNSFPYRSVYVHPNRGKMNVVANCTPVYNCSYGPCDSVLSWTARDSHHRHYAIMPQFCSLACKFRTYVRSPSGSNVAFDRPAPAWDSNPGADYFPTTLTNRIGTTSTHGPDFQDRINKWTED